MRDKLLEGDKVQVKFRELLTWVGMFRNKNA